MTVSKPTHVQYNFFLDGVLIGHAELGVDRSMGILSGALRPTVAYVRIQPFFQAFRSLLDGESLPQDDVFATATLPELQAKWEALDLRCVDPEIACRVPTEWIDISDYSQYLGKEAIEVTIHVDDREYWDNYDRLNDDRSKSAN
jgi:hypothetical protein